MTVTGRERKQGPFRAGRLYPRPSGVAGGDGRAHRQLRRQGSANCITIIASMYWRAADPSGMGCLLRASTWDRAEVAH